MAHPITRNCFLSTNESNFLKIQCKLDSIDSIEKKQCAKQLSDRIRKSDVRKNHGDAELRLKGQDGNQFLQRFSLSELEDNKYHNFDIDSKRYSSGEILSITGGGVSTWESHSDKGVVSTCMTYEYNNGKKSFTPGCPLF